MFHREISRLVGIFFLCYTVILLIPIAVCLYEQATDPQAFPTHEMALKGFLLTLGVCLALGSSLYMIGRHSNQHIFWREGLILAVCFWLIAPAIGGLPFFFSHTLENPVQAFFEATSGYTTTGATVMEAKQYDPKTGGEIPHTATPYLNSEKSFPYFGTITPLRDPQTGKILKEGIEAVDTSLLFWRGFMQWLGGIGIVVLFLAILPLLGIGGKVLLQAEMPGPIKDVWTPRVKETIIELSKIYLFLTAIQVILLHITNPSIGWIESCTISFATISTGGFSPTNESIASYHSHATEWVVILFMFLGSLNFTLYFHSIRGRIYRLYDPELLTYLVTIMIGIALVWWYMVGVPEAPLEGAPHGNYSIESAGRIAVFQLISAITSTGFASSNYDNWPYAPQFLLILAMFLGGMSGSTAGGMKTMRQYIGFHVIKNLVESMFRPGTIRRFIIGTRVIDTNIAMTTLSYLVVLAFFTILGWLLLVLSGVGIWTSLGAVAACINNAGLGFGTVGAKFSFASLTDYQLIICTILMLLGRLEFFALLVLLVPAFWRESL